MATKDTDKVVVSEAVPMFEKSEIVKSADLFGVTPEVMAGALTLVDSTTVTKTEAADAVKAYMARPVRKG